MLRAYRAGAFFGAHGHIARRVELTVEADGLPRPAYPGETVALPAGTSITVRLRASVPESDWRGDPNWVDDVELIAIDETSARIAAEEPCPRDGDVRFLPIEVPRGGLVLRARGRKIIPDSPHLLFYTNPIRIRVPE